MIEEFVRPLSAAEGRLLRATVGTLRRTRRCQLYRGPVAVVAICGVLCWVTLLASREATASIVCGWAVAAVLLAGLGTFETWRGFGSKIRRYEAALSRQEAWVIRITSRRVVQLETAFIDEGECYGFVQPDGGVVFVAGHEVFANRRFPSSDFSLVWFLDPSPFDQLIVSHGVRLEPSRVISIEDQAHLRRPEHLELVHGTVDDVEEALAVDPNARVDGDRRT